MDFMDLGNGNFFDYLLVSPLVVQLFDNAIVPTTGDGVRNTADKLRKEYSDQHKGSQ